MGNSVSNEKAESARMLTRVPKHLQPIKRKQTPKKPNSALSNQEKNTSSETNSQVKPESSSSNIQFKWSQRQKIPNINNIEYFLPNDQIEQDRHRVLFYVIRWAFGSRHIVPPEIKTKLFKGISVLDINCGPGLWVGHPILDMAQDFVRSTFNLVDICSLLPQHESFDFQPRMEEQKSFDNFTFTNHNIVKNKRLPFESDHFDYVQQNLTALTYKYEDWPFILEEMSRVTKPGGYIQLIELDLIPHHLGPQGELWLDQVRQGLKENRNLEPKITLELEQLLKNIGLVDVQSKFVSVPLGSWGLDIGSLWKENYDLFFSSAKPYLTEILNISSRDYKKHVHAFMEELDEYRPFSNIHLVWGRIPKTS